MRREDEPVEESLTAGSVSQLRASAEWSPTWWALAILMSLSVIVMVWPGLADGKAAKNTLSAATTETRRGNPILRADGAWQPSETTWGEQLRDPAFWAGRKGSSSGWTSGSNARSGLTRATSSDAASERSSVTRTSIPLRNQRKINSDVSNGVDEDDNGRSGSKTYRTMCVRLCDGYYWPVNYAVTKDKFQDDAAACARTCGGPSEAKLFTYRNPGGEIEEMEDSDGRAYKKLQNAFSFRTKYEASCKCRPHPWEEASTDRHKTYALATQALKGNQAAAQQLKELRLKLQGEAKAASKDKAAQAKSKAKSADLAPRARAANAAAASLSAATTVRRRGDAAESGSFSTAPSRAPPRTADAGIEVDRDKSGRVMLRLGGQAVREVRVPHANRAVQAETSDTGVLRR